VREAERLARRIQNPPRVTEKPAPDRDLLRLEEELSDNLGASVRIHADRKGTGKVTIHFDDLDQLEGILGRLRQ
jgi:ParB family chromosome partitioning protein